MILPPTINSQDRKEHDLNDLRVYYLVCEELGIENDDSIQQSFHYLMQWAGNSKFLDEFLVFIRYIEKKKEDLDKKL